MFFWLKTFDLNCWLRALAQEPLLGPKRTTEHSSPCVQSRKRRPPEMGSLGQLSQETGLKAVPTNSLFFNLPGLLGEDSHRLAIGRCFGHTDRLAYQNKQVIR